MCEATDDENREVLRGTSTPDFEYQVTSGNAELDSLFTKLGSRHITLANFKVFVAVATIIEFPYLQKAQAQAQTQVQGWFAVDLVHVGFAPPPKPAN